MIANAMLTELLLLRQGAEFFALELTAAIEAMEPPVLAPLPDAPASLLGMLTDRGAAIPVFAASRILEVEGRGNGDEVLVIVRDGERQVGLVVDEVEDVIMADLTTMQRPLDSMRGDGLVRGVVHSGNRLVAVLDARAVVRIGARALPDCA
ncbi:MAG: chemotaxis protein CheW [Gemmatimonadaceae bacterium]|nr:chemotaxis protein CheW [Gemmatimonadaceae bacterium]